MSINPALILARLDWERQHVALGGEILEPANEVVRMRATDGSHHVIIWSNLTPADADQIIDREIARHRHLDVTFEWKVYSHDRPADLRERLAVRGFEAGEKESVMILDLGSEAEASRKTRADDRKASRREGTEAQSEFETRVERVQSMEQLQVFKNLAEEIFGGDWTYTTSQLQAALAAEPVTHRGYIGYLGHEPASIGRLYVLKDSQFAGLYGGGTLPSQRGRGAYRATVIARIEDAIEWGARYVMVDARESSRPILERLGFRSIAETWPCLWLG